jgi:hypothetical protein
MKSEHVRALICFLWGSVTFHEQTTRRSEKYARTPAFHVVRQT